MSSPLLPLYHKHVGAVFDRQMRLNDFLTEHGDGGPWSYDVPTAALTFGETIQFTAPLLGSFAENNATWLWAWANRHLNLPASNATLAKTVRRLDRAPGLALFAADSAVDCADVLPEVLIDEASHVMGVVVTGELAYDAYYTLPYEGGRGVALIQDDRLRVACDNPVARIVTIFPQAISSYPVIDHQAAFVAYVQSCGLQTEEQKRKVRVSANGAEVMTAEFDAQKRMTDLKASLEPSEPA